MKRSVSHSCATQGKPARVKEKEAVCGTVLVCAMIWPVLRCHHTSGSLTLRADRARIPSKTTARKVRLEVSHSCMRLCIMRPPSYIAGNGRTGYNRVALCPLSKYNLPLHSCPEESRRRENRKYAGA